MKLTCAQLCIKYCRGPQPHLATEVSCHVATTNVLSTKCLHHGDVHLVLPLLLAAIQLVFFDMPTKMAKCTLPHLHNFEWVYLQVGELHAHLLQKVANKIGL